MFLQEELVCLDLEAVSVILEFHFFWSEAIVLLDFANSLLFAPFRLRQEDALVKRISEEAWRTGSCCASKF